MAAHDLVGALRGLVDPPYQPLENTKALSKRLGREIFGLRRSARQACEEEHGLVHQAIDVAFEAVEFLDDVQIANEQWAQREEAIWAIVGEFLPKDAQWFVIGRGHLFEIEDWLEAQGFVWQIVDPNRPQAILVATNPDQVVLFLLRWSNEVLSQGRV